MNSFPLSLLSVHDVFAPNSHSLAAAAADAPGEQQEEINSLFFLHVRGSHCHCQWYTADITWPNDNEDNGRENPASLCPVLLYSCPFHSISLSHQFQFSHSDAVPALTSKKENELAARVANAVAFRKSRIPPSTSSRVDSIREERAKVHFLVGNAGFFH
jgi:hypothetical protein